jgi:hypothetical protein
VLSSSGTGSVPLPPALTPQLQTLNFNYGDAVTNQIDREVHTLAVDLFVNGAIGAAGAWTPMPSR